MLEILKFKIVKGPLINPKRTFLLLILSGTKCRAKSDYGWALRKKELVKI